MEYTSCSVYSIRSLLSCKLTRPRARTAPLCKAYWMRSTRSGSQLRMPCQRSILQLPLFSAMPKLKRAAWSKRVLEELLLRRGMTHSRVRRRRANVGVILP